MPDLAGCFTMPRIGIAIRKTRTCLAIAAIAIVAVRFVAIGVPAVASWSSQLMSALNVPFRTWAGIRGGHFGCACTLGSRQPR
jgi:hypothetical protein